MRWCALALAATLAGCAGSPQTPGATSPGAPVARTASDDGSSLDALLADQARKDRRATRSLRRYLRANFAATTWYPAIERVRASGGHVQARTDIYHDAEGERMARTICGAIRYGPGVASVTVFGRDGGGLARC